MIKQSYFIFLMVCLLGMVNAVAQDVNVEQRYTYKKGDPNGIGKWYMGREIAHVMGYQGIDWLERSEREEEEKTTTLISNMAITLTDVIADIGAGSGYHVFKMAPMVDNGFIYAVDIQPEMIAALTYRIEKEQIKNVKTIKSEAQRTNLPENSVNKVLLVDVYHEFSFPFEMMISIKKALKPNGKVFLIEYKGEDNTVPIKRLHKMTQKQAVREMEAAGFKLEINRGNLPWQHCMVFVKK